MNHHFSLPAVLTVAMAAVVAGAAFAAPQAQPTAAASQPRPKLDSNGDGAVDRNEAAAHPRLAERFDGLDANKDGRLDASERPHGRGKGGHHGGGHRGGRHHDGMSRVIAADADGDGRISRAEAAQLPKIAGAFDAIDRNRDGQVVRSELRSYHERQRTQRGAERGKRFDERFAAADLNRDGKLSRVEVSEKMPHLAKGFAFMDEDRDGFLGRDDLRPSRPR
ncbi:EF-hand domain-containing protein [Lysobacter cavernae]|uniref:EF-hand domain-containing protein n=1 Tax=Lysobacter cavernae TaxID=1685901 RepID=A0ABV7RR92_9GAMM